MELHNSVTYRINNDIVDSRVGGVEWVVYNLEISTFNHLTAIFKLCRKATRGFYLSLTHTPSLLPIIYSTAPNKTSIESVFIKMSDFHLDFECREIEEIDTKLF